MGRAITNLGRMKRMMVATVVVSNTTGINIIVVGSVGAEVSKIKTVQATSSTSFGYLRAEASLFATVYTVWN